jgi:hypothetical protein
LGCESDFVAEANVPERAKKSVTVTGQGDIAPFSGQRRFRKMAHRTPQGSGGVTLNNNGVEPQAGHLNFSNHIAFHEEMRFRERASLLEFLQLNGLISAGIRIHKAGVAQGKNAEGKEDVASSMKDVR